MAKTMKLARVHGAGDMRIDEVPKPEAGPRDVVVRVLASGICGTDLGYIARGGTGAPLQAPMPLGHEFAGIVESVGTQVEGVEIGMRCAVNPDDGFIGNGGAEGAMAPFILVPQAKIGSTIYPIPDDLPIEHAALAEPLSVGLHAINIAQVSPQSKVVVMGAGPIGLCTIVGLRHKGVSNIVAVDLSDARLARAKALGASTIVNPSSQSLHDVLREAHGAAEWLGAPVVGSDVFFDTAGAPKALQDALDVAKHRSKFVIVALHKHAFPMDLFKMMANEIMMVGSIAVARHAEFGECIDMLRAGKVNVDPLISHRISFDEIERAFDVARDVDGSAKVMLTFANA